MEFMTIIGFIAAACTTFSTLPQLIKIIKMKETRDLSLEMYLLMTTGVALWLAYGIYRQDIVLICANSVSFFFNMAILVLKLRYK
jgi:MtN3 and saliva related transmembrane protein